MKFELYRLKLKGTFIHIKNFDSIVVDEHTAFSLDVPLRKGRPLEISKKLITRNSP